MVNVWKKTPAKEVKPQNLVSFYIHIPVEIKVSHETVLYGRLIGELICNWNADRRYYTGKAKDWENNIPERGDTHLRILKDFKSWCIKTANCCMYSLT